MVAAALLAAAVVAQVVAGAPTAASVTIYRDRALSTTELSGFDPASGLAMITETRVVDVAAGPQRIAFRGVADTLVPETVALNGLPGRIVERNEDFDLLSPGSLFARSLGQPVQVVQTDRKTGKASVRTAVLRSGPDGVVMDFNGRAEVLGCGGPPTRLVFDHVPEGLGDKPTFSLLADVPKAGRYTVKLSYLATGFTWTADYVARIRPDGKTLDLDGWLTLANKSAAGFALAPTQVVAGQLERDGATKPPEVQPERLTPACWPFGPTGQPAPPKMMMAPLAVPAVFARRAELDEIVVTGSKLKAIQSELGDYKLYTLPEPTTVAARQTKQVAFLEETAVPFERVYVYRYYDGDSDADPDDPVKAPDVVLRLQNKRASGLGKPLPAGNVTVMEDAAGAAAVAGQHGIEDTAVGLPVELRLGQAMDIGVAARTTGETRRGHTVSHTVVATLVNNKPQSVTLEFHQPRGGDDFKIVRASDRATPKAGDQIWTLRLAPGERRELSYTYSYTE